MSKISKSTGTKTALIAALSLTGLPALSDTITGNLTVRDDLCVGNACADGGVEAFDIEDLKIKDATPELLFEDATDSTSPFAKNDWKLVANRSTIDFFAIEDVDGNTIPFRVDAGARADALRIRSSGFIGIGTGMPIEDVHIRSGSNPTIRLEQEARHETQQALIDAQQDTIKTQQAETAALT
ncbi:MAG: hypothetical protein AAF943_18660, partial [Pseudomonadota bacterium]